MSLSNPVNPPLVHEAAAKPVATGQVFAVDENSTKVNQLHGITSNNQQGAGIPKQVTNVQVSIANAATGSTCTISVLFKADPTDKSFSGVNIWVKGYQGNNNPVQVGSGTTSPTKVVLNNTGETVSFIVQAYGNGGNAPFNQSPTCSGRLPQSSSGGFGSSTVTSTPLTLSGDVVVTSPSTVATVDGLQTTPISAVKPRPGYMLGYSIYGDSKWEAFNPAIGPQSIGAWIDPGTAGTTIATSGTGQTLTSGGPTGFTTTGVTATATDPYMWRWTAPSSASTSSFGLDLMASGSVNRIPLGLIRGFTTRLRMNNTSNCRYWFGAKYSTAGAANTTTFATDTPASSNFFIGFRFSAGTDSSIACVCNNNGVQTVVASGVAVDTAHTHLYEWAYVSGTVFFYIDGVLVATISTNVPANTQGLGIGIYGDNKNTANAISLDVKQAYLLLLS